MIQGVTLTDDEWALIRAIRESGRAVKVQPNITAEELETLLALREGRARVVAVPRRVHGRGERDEYGNVWPSRPAVVRCAERVKRGTGYVTCGAILDRHGNCPVASYHEKEN
jgi:hypothetical protein